MLVLLGYLWLSLLYCLFLIYGLRVNCLIGEAVRYYEGFVGNVANLCVR